MPIDVAPVETLRKSAPAPAVSAPADLVDPPSAETLPPPPLPPSAPEPQREASLPPPLPSSTPGARASAPLPPPSRASQPRASSPSFLSRPTVPSSAALPLPNAASVSRSGAASLPPPTAPVAAPFKSRTGSHAVTPQQYPVVQRPRTIDATGDVIRAENWFELSAAVPKIDQSEGTMIVSRAPGETRRMIKRLILPAVLVGIAAGTLGAYLAVGNKRASTQRAATPAVATGTAEIHHTMPAATPTIEASPTGEAPNADVAAAPAGEVASADVAAAVPEPAAASAESAVPAPADVADPAVAVPGTAEAAVAETSPAAAVASAPVAEAPAARVAATLVDVRINSTPPGATVMLVDNGKTTFLGSTPLATSLDPSRRYDVIFTLPGRPTQMEPFDPAKTTTLDVELRRAKTGRHAKHAAPAPSLDRSFVETAAPKAEREHVAPKAERAKREKHVAKAEHAKREKHVAKAERVAAGEGTLMVSSKPPCELVIDGKKTGLTTPQRSISLSTGKHEVTFINASAGINKTVRVSIRADKPTKLIQDLMKH